MKTAPLAAEIKLWSRGLDVVAVRRALWRANYLRHAKGSPFPSLAGPFLIAAIRRFQKDKRLSVDGVYGITTHRALLPKFDSLARSLMCREAVRQTALRYLQIAGWPYSMSRPNPVVAGKLRKQVAGIWIPSAAPNASDCSDFFEDTYYVPGLIRLLGPAGDDGYRNTYKLADHGQAIDVSQLQPGDAVLYNVPGDTQGPPNHVGVYLGAQKVARHAIADDGQSGGPFLHDVNVEPIWGCRTYL